MSDLIDRQAVIDLMRSGISLDTEGDQDYICGLINDMPSVTPAETQMIDKSNFSQEQYKMDLQSAYDCGVASVTPAERATYRKKAKRWKKKYFALKTEIEKAKAEIYEKAKEREFYLDSGHPHNGLYEALKIINKHLKAERSDKE